MTPFEKMRDALAWRSPLNNFPMAHVVLERKDAEVVLAHIDLLTKAIKRIDGINDNPSHFNVQINDVCDSILRPELKR